jgi:quercetin dioxygenase-like cupin family protein
MRIKVDSVRNKGVAMSMVVSEVAPGAAIPVHRHRNEDELIFIQSGEGVLTLGDRTIPVSAGAMLYGPRGIWHGITNTGTETLLWCAIFSPAGFEQFFKEVGVPPSEEKKLPAAAQVDAIAAKYGLEFRDA